MREGLNNKPGISGTVIKGVLTNESINSDQCFKKLILVAIYFGSRLFVLFCFFVVLWFELRSSPLLGKHSNT
jgi:hypothetical protein